MIYLLEAAWRIATGRQGAPSFDRADAHATCPCLYCGRYRALWAGIRIPI